MVYTVVCVRDLAAAAYNTPIFTASAGVALRSFQDEVNRRDADNNFNKHPGDFDLFEIGTYDDSTATFKLHEMPKLLANGASVLAV